MLFKELAIELENREYTLLSIPILTQEMLTSLAPLRLFISSLQLV